MGKMVVAHHIRTPLSAAILYGGHLTEPDLDEEMRQRCANRLMSRLSHLEQQVRDMLIFALGETRLAEELSVTTLAVALKLAVDAIAERSGAQLTLDALEAEGQLLCNRDALVGACTNLVNNSIEAGATSVRLNLRGCDHELAIEVSDNGPGFDPAMAPRLQEAFYTTKSHGTGLGLAVVQAVVNAHQGRFAMTSNGQGGAQARLHLPLLSRSN